MTEPYAQPAAPVENVGRGAAFALLTIPASIIIFAIVGGVFGLITGLAAIFVPYIAGWLYAKGAGAPLSRAGWGAYGAIAAVSVILGVAVGLVGGFYHSFSRVGGDGGVLGAAFWTTVRNQLSTNFADNAFAIVIGLGLGLVGIVAVLRGRALNSGRGLGKGNLAQSNMPGSIAGTRPEPNQPTTSAPPAPAATPPTAAAPPAPNLPSPGIMLNGKPLDPDKK